LPAPLLLREVKVTLGSEVRMAPRGNPELEESLDPRESKDSLDCLVQPVKLDRRERLVFPVQRVNLETLDPPVSLENLDPLEGRECLDVAEQTEIPVPRDPPVRSVKPADLDLKDPPDLWDHLDSQETLDLKESRAQWERQDPRGDPERTVFPVSQACQDRREVAVKTALLEEKAPQDPPVPKDSAERTESLAFPARQVPRVP